MKKLLYLFAIVLFAGLVNVNAQTKSETSEDLKITKEYTNISAVDEAESGDQKAESTEAHKCAPGCTKACCANKKECTKKQKKECKKKNSGSATKAECPHHKAALEQKEKEEQEKK